MGFGIWPANQLGGIYDAKGNPFEVPIKSAILVPILSSVANPSGGTRIGLFESNVQVVGSKLAIGTDVVIAQPGTYRLEGWTGRFTGSAGQVVTTVVDAVLGSGFIAGRAEHDDGRTVPARNLVTITEETSFEFRISSGPGSGTLAASGASFFVQEV